MHTQFIMHIKVFNNHNQSWRNLVKKIANFGLAARCKQLNIYFGSSTCSFAYET